jgi:uncharacterized protein YeaO (DUF488 family)
MTLHVRTARVSYGGPDRLDVTRKTGDDFGLAFAPSWKLLGPVLQARAAEQLDEDAWREYVAAYTDEMRASYRANPNAWAAILRMERVVLVCYCTDPVRCHRRVLAGVLAKLGAVDEGELEHAQGSLGL